ncbi:MAG: PD-(D/E)XK nuclease family protein, partial [Polyangiaceae bacterium]
TWHPPRALLKDDHSGARAAELRESRAAPIFTSYTRLRNEREAWGPSTRSDAAGAWQSDDSAEPIADVPRTTLRGGRSAGIALHEMLERVPVMSFAAARTFDEWRLRSDTAALVDEIMAVHRVDPEQRVYAERLVWAAYTTEVILPDGTPFGGFARAARIVREMEFVYPIAPPLDPALTEDQRALSPRRVMGYVRGSLDLVFEHQGLTYLVDWKSDTLASYSRGSLGLHVAAHYEEQAIFYTLAVVRLLGIRTPEAHAARFGGIIYCFLRGLGPGGQGLWSSRPSFGEVLAWDDGLRNRKGWARAFSS